MSAEVVARSSHSSAALDRIRRLVRDEATRALQQVLVAHFAPDASRWWQKDVENAVGLALDKRLRKLEEAARLGRSVHEVVAKEETIRRQKRAQLASEMYWARKRLRELKWKINHMEEVVQEEIAAERRAERKQWANRMRQTRKNYEVLKQRFDRHGSDLSKIVATYAGSPDDTPAQYASVPMPELFPHPEGLGLPYSAGIYFLWKDGAVEYVGKSIRLAHRVRLGTHHVLRAGHQISFLLCDPSSLDWAECYYIGVCRPKKNFGLSAAHRRET